MGFNITPDEVRQMEANDLRSENRKLKEQVEQNRVDIVFMREVIQSLQDRVEHLQRAVFPR